MIELYIGIILGLLTIWGKLYSDFRKSKLDLEKEKHKFELERVNDQLQNFYGPLLALTEANSIAYNGFSDKYLGTNLLNPKLRSNNFKRTPNEKQKAYILWMKTVFFENNKKIKEIILTRVDLLIEDKLPDCINEFCAYEMSLIPVQKKWENEDFSETQGILKYPKSLKHYLSDSFDTLKKKQIDLIKRIED